MSQSPLIKELQEYLAIDTAVSRLLLQTMRKYLSEMELQVVLPPSSDLKIEEQVTLVLGNQKVAKVHVPEGKRPSHVTVVARPNEDPMRTIKRFLKQCKKERIVEQIRERQYFVQPSKKRRLEEKNKKRKKKMRRKRPINTKI